MVYCVYYELCDCCQIMKLRRMLTEILLEVTNQEIDAVAAEVYEEEKSMLSSLVYD